jgi:hypothetical protein
MQDLDHQIAIERQRRYRDEAAEWMQVRRSRPTARVAATLRRLVGRVRT